MENPGWYQWLLVHLPVLQVLTLLAIAVGVLLHVLECHRARKAAQTQSEVARARFEDAYGRNLELVETVRADQRASRKPSLVLLVEQSAASMGEGKLGLQRVSLKNIGLGSAFNVRVHSIEYQEYRIEFDPLDYVEKDKSRPLGFVASSGGHYSGLARSLILLETALLAEKNSVVSEIPLAYSYGDAFGIRYRTNAEVIVDHMSGKVTVKYSNLCSPE
jgi:hypothetical protein